MYKSFGGPWAQWDWRFNYESQLFTAQGYVVIMPNPRGSWGYGQAFTDALVGDWGGIDYGDFMTAMGFAIEKGWIDSDRMAVYGWSYGGFMTNQIITKTDRFKAAISGAGETLVAANYGHDEKSMRSLRRLTKFCITSSNNVTISNTLRPLQQAAPGCYSAFSKAS